MRRPLLAVLGLVVITGVTQAEVIPPASPVAGISQATLADQWSAWILMTPNADNPLTNDPTGANAGVNNNGPVFLLAGSPGGGFINRMIKVPVGRPLFIPLINDTDLELSPDVAASIGVSTCQGITPPPTPYECALAFIPPQTPSGLIATLDGTPLDPNLNGDYATYFQQSSALVPVNLPPGNVFGYPADPGAEFVQNGYYMAIDGLLPGTYTLIFGGTDSASGVTYGAIDTINVTPEPASIMLLGMGLAGLGFFRRRKAH
jgi:PEP-CTERM motif